MSEKNKIIWSPWIINEQGDINSNTIEFNRPIKQEIIYNENIMEKIKEYRIKSGSIIETDCDFFVNNTRINSIRKRAWKIIEERQDCLFILNTSYIDNFYIRLPSTWNKGWQNVMIQLHINPNENIEDINRKINLLLKLPLRYRAIMIEPINKYIELEKYLASGFIDKVICSGGSEENRNMQIVIDKLNSKINRKQNLMTEHQWKELYDPDDSLKIFGINDTCNKVNKNNCIEKVEQSVGFVDIGDNTHLFFPIPIFSKLEENKEYIKTEQYSDLNVVKQIRDKCELYDIEFAFKSTGDKIVIKDKLYKIKSESDKQSLADFFELNITERTFNWKADLKQIENQNTIKNAAKLYEKLLGTHYIERKM